MTKNHSFTTGTFAPSFDTSIRPQDDFFQYVNNRWIEANPIPPSESRWGVFSVLRDQAWQHMKAIYEELEKAEASPGTVEQQARDLYFTATHTDQFEAAHLAIIDEYFEKIEAIEDLTQLSALIGDLHAIGVEVPWGAVIDTDNKDSAAHIFRLVQDGLTLPSRDYYLEDSDTMRVVREAFVAHLSDVYQHFPALARDIEQLEAGIMQFETQLAQVSRSNAALRDVENNYHKTTYAALQETYGNIDWPAYAATLGWLPSDQISVDQPEFLAFVNERFTSQHLDEWKLYLKWRFLCNHYGRISERFARLKFEFFGKVLAGTSELLPLWKRAVLTIDDLMGEGVGRLYTERHFPESSKKQVNDIVELVRDTYEKRITNLDWMDPKTKQYALRKLANMKVLIGYPDEWRDFSGLALGRESHLANVMAGERFKNAYHLDKLHQPTSRDDWLMNPQTVNAYHDPGRLVICFPAAILQAPFFDPAAPLAANLGGIGSVVGHELSHGFDDQGYQFDAEGNVRVWQTEADRKAFTERAQIIIDQADNYEVLPGVKMKGQLVVGETIADLGGLEIAFDALQSLPADDIAVDGSLTPQQLYFVAYATIECGATREAKLREQAMTDPHPVGEFRVNGVLSHVDGFYEAFGVGEDDALYLPPAARAKIW